MFLSRWGARDRSFLLGLKKEEKAADNDGKNNDNGQEGC